MANVQCLITNVQCSLLLLVIGLLCACQYQASSPTLFAEHPPEHSGLDFVNRLPEQSPDSMNILQYLYYYNGGGVAAGDLNNDGLPDLYFTSNLEPNRLYLNKGGFRFEDATARSGAGGSGSWKTGVCMADVNADGWLDIYVCQVGQYKAFRGKNQLFINNQNGTFSERAAEYGLDLSAFCTQAVFFDYDLDNDLDCFVLCHSVHSPASYKEVDIARRFDPQSSDRLFRNDGGHFTDVTATSGLHDGSSGYGLGVAVGDLNADGYPDIYVGNDFHENDYLYYNLKGLRFVEDIEYSMGHTSNFTMGCDLADINNDSRPDLVSLDMKPEDEVLLKSSQPADQYPVYEYKHSFGYHWQFPRNNLQLNQGNEWSGPPLPKTSKAASPPMAGLPRALFSEIGQLAGVATTDWSWSALLADFDLDGWKDLYITNGIPHRPNNMDYIRFTASAGVQQHASDLEFVAKMPAGEAANACFKNNKNLRFEDVSQAWGLQLTGCSNGAAYADFDNDGDLDLVVNNLNQPASLYENQTQGRNFLKLKLEGAGANRLAIGARVTLECAGGRQQMLELQPVRGFQSAVEPTLLFGLDTLKTVQQVHIRWPDGSRQTLAGPLAANQTLTIRQEKGLAQTPEASTSPVFFSAKKWSIPHLTDPVEDILREKLLPWSLNTQDPRLAVGDIDGDGYDDFYLPQTLGGQAGRQTETGFEEGFVLHQKNETCATFFDANGDGAPDLYLGTGGNRLSNNEPGQQDFLLLNDGKGHFTDPVPGSLPDIRQNTACARPADVDADGDLDLFVGNRSVTGAYGHTPPAYLLLNDGQGRFTVDPSPSWAVACGALGMVTDAQWADLDGDGRLELVVCGEWMALTILRNTSKGWSSTRIPQSNGLWNCLSVADLDADGDLDLLAGNFGLNSILRATPEEPLGLWVNDIDHNGAPDPILTYVRQGKNRVFADKDWLISQLPAVKKRYVQYQAYAESTFEEVFPAAVLKGASYLHAEVLESCWVENLGGKAGWRLHPLPVEAQFSPVFALLPGDFDADGHIDVLLGGNFYEIQPAIGRQDASGGCWLRGLGKGRWAAVPAAESGFRLRGALRDLRALRGPGGRLRVLAASNSGPVQYFDFQSH